MDGLTFRKSKRLLTARDYKHVFDNNSLRASHKNLLILACPNGFNHPRLGIIVAKKNARRAVDRNRLKRIIREQYRLLQHQLANLDMIVLARPGLVNQNNQQLAALMKSHLDKMMQQSNIN